LDLPRRVVVVGRKGARHRNSQQRERGEKAQSCLHRVIPPPPAAFADLYGHLGTQCKAMAIMLTRAGLSCPQFIRINGKAVSAEGSLGEGNMADTSELYARGLRRRKKMFGEADVEKRMGASGEYGAPLQYI